MKGALVLLDGFVETSGVIEGEREVGNIRLIPRGRLDGLVQQFNGCFIFLFA